MLRIVNYSGELIEKDGLGLSKGDAVLLLVGTVLFWIPLEAQVQPTYSVTTIGGRSTLTSNVADERPRSAASEGSKPRAARSAGTSSIPVRSMAWLGCALRLCLY